jgi:U3 small nucleolar RNA-associated protein 14
MSNLTYEQLCTLVYCQKEKIAKIESAWQDAELRADKNLKRVEELEEKLTLAERCIRTRESWAGYCALELMPKLGKEAGR